LAADAGTRLVADPWLLSRRANGAEPCLPDGLTNGFERLCRTAGLVDVDPADPEKTRHRYHLHDLRHFAATQALAGNIDPPTVAGRLGHADASITMRIYGHVVEARDQAAAELLVNLQLLPPGP
jgi:integrase